MDICFFVNHWLWELKKYGGHHAFLGFMGDRSICTFLPNSGREIHCAYGDKLTNFALPLIKKVPFPRKF